MGKKTAASRVKEPVDPTLFGMAEVVEIFERPHDFPEWVPVLRGTFIQLQRFVAKCADIPDLQLTREAVDKIAASLVNLYGFDGKEEVLQLPLGQILEMVLSKPDAFKRVFANWPTHLIQKANETEREAAKKAELGKIAIRFLSQQLLSNVEESATQAGQEQGEFQTADLQQATGEVPEPLTDGDELHDGPASGNRFNYVGCRHEMSPVPWRLLNAMWDSDSRVIHDVIEEVWEGSSAPESIGTSLHRLNKFLEKVGYPRRIKKARRTDDLLWQSAET